MEGTNASTTVSPLNLKVLLGMSKLAHRIGVKTTPSVVLVDEKAEYHYRGI